LDTKHAQRKAQEALALLVDTGQAWISRLRLRALVWILGIALATTAMVLLTSVSWVPVVGVAVAAAAMSINKVASRLSKPTCWSCGHDLSAQPVNNWGAACPTCGALNQPRPDEAAGLALREQADQIDIADGHDSAPVEGGESKT